jgi:hypothetical protein
MTARQTDVDDVPVDVRSLYGRDTGQPYVQLRLGAVQVQLPVDQARTLAAWILEAAEAATIDAFIVEFAMESLEQDVEHAALLLHAFRSWRAAKVL